MKKMHKLADGKLKIEFVDVEYNNYVVSSYIDTSNPEIHLVIKGKQPYLVSTEYLDLNRYPGNPSLGPSPKSIHLDAEPKLKALTAAFLTDKDLP